MLRQPVSPVVNFTHMPSKYDFGSGDPDGAGEGAEFPAIAVGTELPEQIESRVGKTVAAETAQGREMGPRHLKAKWHFGKTFMYSTQVKTGGD